MPKTLACVQLLILDNWATAPPAAEQRRGLMKVADNRHDRASTTVTSQVAVELWYEHIGNPTIADAVLDRPMHGAHRLELKRALGSPAAGPAGCKPAARRSALSSASSRCAGSTGC